MIKWILGGLVFLSWVIYCIIQWGMLVGFILGCGSSILMAMVILPLHKATLWVLKPHS